VADLGGSIDELYFDLLGLPALGGREHRLANHNRTLARTDDSTLDKQEVLVDFTVVREATHGGDVLLDGIVGGGSVVGYATACTGTHAIDFLVKLRARVIAHLTTTTDSPLDCSGMPRTDTTDLTETTMSLSGEAVNTETLDGSLGSLTPGHTDHVNALIFFKALTNGDFLLLSSSLKRSAYLLKHFFLAAVQLR